MKKSELVFIPAPGMGHVTPMVELAKQLTDRDHRLSVTILVLKPPSFANDIVDAYIESFSATAAVPAASSIRFIKLPTPPPSSKSFTTNGPAMLRDLIEDCKSDIKQTITSKVLLINNSSSSSNLDDNSVHCQLAGLVIDFFFTTLIDVANELGAPTYLYFTSGAAVLGFMLYLPTFDAHNLDESDELIIPSYANPVPHSVLPSSFLNKDDDIYRFFLYNTRRFRETKGIMVNSFYDFEPYAFNSFLEDTTVPPVYPIGPVLDLKAGQRQSQPDQACLYDQIMKWLDDQPTSSVILLCFGSMGSFDEQQAKEIAIGLEQSGQRFLWSLRQPSKAAFGLPNDYANYEEILPDGFLERTKGRGLVCGWVPQVAVLGHQAVGGFVSHCGWNSTLESIWFGVPLLTWPMYAEQQVNAFEMVKELGLAVELRLDYRMRGGGSDLILGDEVERGVRCLMDVDRTYDVRKKVKEMMENSRMAVSRDNNGSSFTSLGLFIEDLIKGNNN